MTFELTAVNAAAYLADRGVISSTALRTAAAETLGGGVSNIVVRVGNLGETGDLVLKQSLPRLRVEQEWLADQERVHREAASLRYLADKLPRDALPQVIHEDPDNFLFVMTSAPRKGVNWKDALLAGEVDVGIASQVGAVIGTIHRLSWVEGDDVPDELRQFADQHCFVQLRIDPYHRATATAHPDLAEVIETEAQRMLNKRLALVHGDYSPKNIIATGVGASAGAFLLDFEVVHLGNPVFDLAFMLNHLTLKAIHRPGLCRKYNAAARAFWSAYLDSVGQMVGDASRLERETLRQLGVLLLARIDGKSPAEYITDDREKRQARNLGRSLLTGMACCLDDLHRALMTPSPAK